MSEELAWAAGFFDGEGNISAHSKAQPKYPRLRVSQSGEAGVELLSRFRDAVGVGKVYGPYPPAKNQRQIRWTFDAWGKEALTAYDRMKPWLGSVKTAQAERFTGG